MTLSLHRIRDMPSLGEAVPFNEVLLRHLIPSKATQPLTARRRDDGNPLPRQTHRGFEPSVPYKGANALRGRPFRFLGTLLDRPTFRLETGALLLTSSPVHGSTPMKNWSGPLPIGSTLAGGLYRCHSRCGEFSPRGPSSSQLSSHPQSGCAHAARQGTSGDCPGLSRLDPHRRKSRIWYL